MYKSRRVSGIFQLHFRTPKEKTAIIQHDIWGAHDMSGFYGTIHQQELQRRTYAMRDWIAATPGLYNAGRFTGVDDPDMIERDTMDHMLERDRILGLRMISPKQAETYFPQLERQGCRIDCWDILIGDVDSVSARVLMIANRALPNGMLAISPSEDADGAAIVKLQAFLAKNGIAPFPGFMLAEQPPRAKTVLLIEDNRIAATGHAYYPHNRHSPFRDYVWIGLIAVDADWRGQGLGTLVHALLVRAAFDELSARRVYAMVAPSNITSRRMVEACGLKLNPDLRCGVAVPIDAARFTR